jgi:hypothetical protein
MGGDALDGWDVYSAVEDGSLQGKVDRQAFFNNDRLGNGGVLHVSGNGSRKSENGVWE